MDGWKTSLLLGWLPGRCELLVSGRVFPGTMFCWGVICRLHILVILELTGKHRNLQKILDAEETDRVSFNEGSPDKQSLQLFFWVLPMGQHLPKSHF